jgi:hypothetical protein
MPITEFKIEKEKMYKPALPALSEYERIVIKQFANHFVVDDERFGEIMTEGQMHIFAEIVFRNHKRVQIICPTQYGKSLTVALACLIVTCVQKRMVSVVAPSSDKAKIIMRYYIEHLGDNEMFEKQLDKDTRLERLRQEGSKDRIILRNGGGIFVVSAEQKNYKKSFASAMGLGAEIVIMDEACLIQDQTEATIFRMIVGKKKESFYCKIGNPWFSTYPYSHFLESWNGRKYFDIYIDYKVALAEGRLRLEDVEEARTKPFFGVLFECEFPSENEIDQNGFRQLIYKQYIRTGITKEALKEVLNKERGLGKYTLKLGCDIGGGGDLNVYVLRFGPFAIVAGSNKSNNTMVNVSEIERLKEEWGFEWVDVSIDDIGIGRGVSDRLKEKGYRVNAVDVGARSRFKDTFFNLKAELYWAVADWIRRENTRLEQDEHWVQFLWIRYTTTSERTAKIESKADLVARSGKSPDFAEALMLTFYEKPFIGII